MLLAIYPKNLTKVTAVTHSNWCSGKSHACCKSIAGSHLCGTITGAWTCLPCSTTMPCSTSYTSSACKGKLPQAAATTAITPESNTFNNYGAKPHAILKYSKNPNT